jgi:hypothetical protein
MKKTLPLVAIIALAACGPTSWQPVRPNTLPMQEALARCQFQANTSPARVVNGGIYTPQALTEMCMNAEGFRPVYAR